MSSKLGGQTGGLFASARQFFQSVQPACWKVYGNALGSEVAYKQWSPRTFIVGREVRGQQFATEDPDPIGTANRYADLVIATAAQHPAIDAWEFYNEPVINISIDGAFNLAASIQAAQRLNLAQLTFSRRLHAVGLKVVAYNFARGNPDYRLVPYLADGLAVSDYFGLHAYFAPHFADDPENQGLRYRRIMALLPPMARRPIIFTEYGTDWNGGGFRLEANQMTPDEFVASCHAFDMALLADSYVAGSCGFVFGADSGRWGTFEMSTEDVLPQLAEAMKDSVPVSAASVGEPIPPVDPPPTTGDEMQPTPAQTIAIVPYLAKAAIKLELGQALYGQYSARANDNTLWDCWIWQRGGVMVEDGKFPADFSGVVLFHPVTGVPMAEPLPWPGGGTPPPVTPPTVKRLTSADLPPELGLKITQHNFPQGTREWWIVQAGGWKLDAGTELIVHCIPLSGPAFDIPVTNRFASGAEKLKTNGAGDVKFDFGHGSAFNPPADPPNRIYVAFAGDQLTPIGDELMFGFPGGSHLEGSVTMMEVLAT